MNQEEQRTLSLFEAVDGDESISQRQMAQKLGLSLGLTNAFLQTVLHKGWVRARQVSARRWAYFLTAEGFREKSRLTMNYLRRTMHLFQEIKIHILQHFVELEQQGCQRIYLCSEGDLREIIHLCLLLSKLELYASISLDELLERPLPILAQDERLFLAVLQDQRSLIMHLQQQGWKVGQHFVCLY
jgi:hypothetical protein